MVRASVFKDPAGAEHDVVQYSKAGVTATITAGEGRLTIYLRVSKENRIFSKVSAQLIDLYSRIRGTLSWHSRFVLRRCCVSRTTHFLMFAPPQYELTPQRNLLSSSLLNRLQTAAA